MVWLENLTKLLVEGRGAQTDASGGIKIIDFSEVPSYVLPLIVSLLARIVFSVQQWTPTDKRHPVAMFCDEAHLYIPERTEADSAGAMSVRDFERIAKEGRKYGIGLVVISQRPAEVNRTVLSQCNNVIAMRLTNGDDQAVIRATDNSHTIVTGTSARPHLKKCSIHIGAVDFMDAKQVVVPRFLPFFINQQMNADRASRFRKL